MTSQQRSKKMIMQDMHINHMNGMIFLMNHMNHMNHCFYRLDCSCIALVPYDVRLFRLLPLLAVASAVVHPRKQLGGAKRDGSGDF